MLSETVICIPGTWNNQGDFLRRVVALKPAGGYLFAGRVLMEVETQDYLPVEIRAADPKMRRAFEIAGQGKIPAEIIERVGQHNSVAYLHFSPDLLHERERILKFAQVLQRLGGIAVKLESAGIGHSWERWSALLSGSLFEVYCAAVVLIGDESHYYSCGMHHFGLPDCEVSRSLPIKEAADLMNDYNFWRIAERPELADGHTFSRNETAFHYRLLLLPDARHTEDVLFHNPQGIWRLSRV